MSVRAVLLVALAFLGTACTPFTEGLQGRDWPATSADTVAERAPTTCDVVWEALLTGSRADVDTAMRALVADTTAPLEARERAQRELGPEGFGYDSVVMACELYQ